jgi:SAM-dependent methyltransferase
MTDFIDLVKEHTPWGIRRISRRIKHHFNRRADARRGVKEVFTNIYLNNLWGGGKTKSDTTYLFDSGVGSGDPTAIPYAECVNNFIQTHEIRRIVDLGCGDFRVGRRIAQKNRYYIGVDVVEPLIEANQSRFASDHVEFRCLDIITDEIPAGDLCLVREVLQHLSNAEILAILPKLSGFRWVIVTEGQPGPPGSFKPNRDKPHGGDSRALWNSGVFLSAPPFNLPRVTLLLSLPSAAEVDNCRGTGRIDTFLIKTPAPAANNGR